VTCSSISRGRVSLITVLMNGSTLTIRLLDKKTGSSPDRVGCYDAFSSFFLHPGSQTAQACHNVSWSLWLLSTDQVRFRFARACQIGDVPVPLPGMLVRRSVHGMQGALGAARRRICCALPHTPGSSVRRACGKHAGFRIERPPSPLSSASAGKALREERKRTRTSSIILHA